MALNGNWLRGESELQLQVVSHRYPGEHALRLTEERSYHILVEACGSSLPRPQVTTKVLDRASGTCEVREQGEVGVPLFGGEKDRIILFIARSSVFDEVEFKLSIFTAAGKLFGRTSLLPKHFLSQDSTKGTSYLDILSPDLQPMGSLHLTHLLIHPVEGLPIVDSVQQCLDWKMGKQTLDIGHRGLGNSYQKNPNRNPAVTENTIESLREAGRCGADYVEFDVQLTQDLVPVVYHDFFVCASLDEDFHKCLVKDFSLAELRSLRLQHTSLVKSEDCVEHGRLDLKESFLCGEEFVGDSEPFPTLEELFAPGKIPEDVGFNIEVKYPIPKLSNSDQEADFTFIDRNKMADQILKVVYNHAKQRRIIFSSFDADMCSILRLKQPLYPVLFLTTNDCPEWKHLYPVDLRCRKIHDALMHAHAQDLQGINVDSHQLLEDSSWVQVVKEERCLWLYTWGNKNNHLSNIEEQKRLGVDGIIYDRVDEVLSAPITSREVEDTVHPED